MLDKLYKMVMEVRSLPVPERKILREKMLMKAEPCIYYLIKSVFELIDREGVKNEAIEI